MEQNQGYSSDLAAVGYDEESQTLAVKFRNNAVYQFYDVPQDIFKNLLQSESKGDYFYTHIRNIYPFSRAS